MVEFAKVCCYRHLIIVSLIWARVACWARAH